MILLTLPSNCDITFEEDGEHFRLKTPYNTEFMVCYSWPFLWKEWLPESKEWRFKAEDFDDVVKLVNDFF